jgi:hypothetical protein|nr:MAG TPA: nucelotide kinase [Herelleviridae sp.]
MSKEKFMNNEIIEWEYSKVGELYCWTILSIRDYKLVRELIEKFNKYENKIKFSLGSFSDYNCLSDMGDFNTNNYSLELCDKEGKDYSDDCDNIGMNYECDFNNLKRLIDYINSYKNNIIEINNNDNYDNINKPNHYQLNIKGNNIQVIDIIDEVVKDYKSQEAFKIANIIKYVLRASKKNGKEDLKKARKYIDMLVGDNDEKM